MKQDTRKLKKCFVISRIGPIGSPERKHSDLVMKYIISPALEPLGFKAERGDHVADPGVITDHIIQRVTEDELIVADLTGGNPNVFYELAVRHVTRKPCIQLVQELERIPFDVSQLRTIRYDLTNPESLEKAKEDLMAQARACLTGGVEVRNPISNSLVTLGLEKSGNKFDQAAGRIIQKVDELTDGFAVLQGQVNLLGHGGDFDSSAQFITRTSIHHQFVHKMRDLCVRRLGRLTDFLPDTIGRSEPHPIFDQVQSDIISILEDLVRMFELLVAPGTKVWACLRDRRRDDHYHTFARAGRFHPTRAEGTSGMHKDNSITVKRLKESFSGGRCVILTGSTRGPEMWTPQKNDSFGEDKSVLMSAVMAKSWNSSTRNWGDRKLMMILSINADQENTFGERHIPLMQCMTDNFSMMVNTLLRIQRNGDQDVDPNA